MKKKLAVFLGLLIGLLSIGQGVQNVGFAPSSGYDKTITVYLNDTSTTINVSSINDDDGIPLALSSSNTGYFTIDPGQADQERVACTGVSGSTLTGCTRGLPADGSIATGSTAYAEDHDVGSRIIMTNIAQFYSNYVNIWDNQTKDGVLTFLDPPVVPAPVSGTDAASKNYVDNREGYWESPVADYASLTDGDNNGETRVTLDDGKIYVWASSTQTWILAGSGGGAGTIYWDFYMGSDGTGNKTFSLSSGSWQDTKWLSIYKNGILMEEGASADYTASTTGNTIMFNSAVADLDKIGMRVDSIDYYNPEWGVVDGDILPDTDNTYDIGSIAKSFKNLVLDGYAVISGAITLGGNFSTLGSMTITGTTTIGDYEVKGNVVDLTASTTITGAATPQPVFIATSSSALELCDANDGYAIGFVGFAISSGGDGDTIKVQTTGIVSGFFWINSRS
jgi:hypothetical protein